MGNVRRVYHCAYIVVLDKVGDVVWVRVAAILWHTPWEPSRPLVVLTLVFLKLLPLLWGLGV